MIKNYLLIQQSPFIGRINELRDVQSRLLNPACRLLTISGMGGSGKTRLAIESARGAGASFEHGVVFVDMQSLVTSDLLATAVGQAVGVTFYGADEPETQLFRHLQDKSLLLLLDNFEHLLDGAPLISRMLAHAPTITILVTSREVLNLQEEWLYPLAGLEMPLSVYSASLEDYEAVQLFTYHAGRVQPHFDPASNREAVAQICRITEGLPLALELVAAWLKSVSVSQIAVELQNNLDILSTRARDIEARHRSVRAVFDQSWKLLSENERVVLAKLSVFRDGFDSPAAEKVANASLVMLSALVEKSLLRMSAEQHYHLHELVRRYGEEKLDQAELAEATRTVYCAYYSAFVNELSPDLKSGKQREALSAIRSDFENIRSAWNWAVQTRQVQRIAEALDGLSAFCELQSRLREGDELLASALEAVANEPLMRSRLLARQSTMKISLGQYETARQLLAESVALAENLRASEHLAYSLQQLARTLCYLGNYQEAEQSCQQSLTIYSELADDWGKAHCLHVLGFILSRKGDIKAAQEHYRQAVGLFRTFGDAHYLNASLLNLGVMCATLSENVEARLFLEESLKIASQIGNRLGMARALDHLGMLLVWGLKDYPGAQPYYEQSLQLRREIGDLPGVGHTLSNMGDIAVKKQEYAEAYQLYSEALAIFRQHNDPWNTALALAGMGDAVTGMGTYDSGLDYFRDALHISAELKAKVLTLSLLVSVIILFTKLAKWELAATLTSLVVWHPDSPPGLKDMAREYFNAGAAENSPKLHSPLDDPAQARILIKRHLDGLAQILMLPLAYLAELVSPVTAVTAVDSRPPNDVLTPRELEILRLLAAGLTNPQIAERLVIGSGTVKTHTLNIYRKLDVANRTQAIIRAQELKLFDR